MSISDVAPEDVYFCFKGDDQQDIPSVTICIRRSLLDGKPDSLLSKLASETWQRRDRQNGTNEFVPIVVKPLDTDIVWIPSMAAAIEALYEGLTPLALPPNVELEELLPTLDYFGLVVDDPSNNVSYTEASEGAEFRAKVYLRVLECLEESKTYINNTLTHAPKPATGFVVIHEDHRVSYIKEANSISCESLRDDNGWSENETYRQLLEAQLRGDGFLVEWRRRHVVVSGPPVDSYSTEFEPITQYLWFLTIKPKQPEPLQKRQKIAL